MAWFNKDRGTQVSEAAEHEAKMRRCIALLMEGVRIHTCNEEDAGAPHFNRLMRQLSTQMESAKDANEILGVITATIEGMMQVRREINAAHVQLREESKLLSRFLMTNLATSLAVHQPDLSESVSQLGPQFERAKTTDDIKALREKLEQLFTPQSERVEAAAPVVKKGWSEQEVEAETADSPTGLRGRTKAKELLLSLHKSGRPAFATIFFFEGYGVLEERFGSDAAQDCFLAASNYLLQALGSEDQLFHWDRTALIAIVKREGGLKDVSIEMMRICAARPQQSIKVGARTVLASMPIKTSVYALHEIPEEAELLKQINQFSQQGL